MYTDNKRISLTFLKILMGRNSNINMISTEILGNLEGYDQNLDPKKYSLT